MQSPAEGAEDPQYWERVLQSSFTSLVESEQKELEEYENKLGRGKRVRKKINYYEQENVSLLCHSYSPSIVMLITRTCKFIVLFIFTINCNAYHKNM